MQKAKRTREFSCYNVIFCYYVVIMELQDNKNVSYCQIGILPQPNTRGVLNENKMP